MSNSSSSSYAFWVWVVLLCFHFVIAAAGGCSVENGRFQMALQSSGLTRPIKGGYDFFECGYGDVWVEAFTAHQYLIAKNGGVVDAVVKGTMCCGIIKGCTIRWP